MSDEISSALEKLSHQPVPVALVRNDSAIMARITSLPAGLGEVPGSIRVLVVLVALSMGIAGGILSDRPNPAQDALYPLEPAVRLAPSTLLTR